MSYTYNTLINNEITVLFFFIILAIFIFYINKFFKNKHYKYFNIIPVLIFILLFLLLIDFTLIIPKTEFIYPHLPFISDSSESMIFKKSVDKKKNVNQYYFGTDLSREFLKYQKADIIQLNKLFSFEDERYFDKIFLYSDGNFDYSSIDAVVNRYNNSNKKIVAVVDSDNDSIINFGISEVRLFDYFLSDTENNIEIIIDYNYNFENAELEFYENNILLKEYNISEKFLKENGNKFTIDFMPINIGKNFYQIKFSNMNDSNHYNHSYDFIKEVVAAYKNIYLIVDNPYYDYKFFKDTLNNFQNINLIECRKFARQELDDNIINNTNLIVLYNINGKKFSVNEINILKNYFNENKPVIIFVGQQTDMDFINVLFADNIISSVSPNLFVTGNIEVDFKNQNKLLPLHFSDVNIPYLEGYKNVVLTDGFENVITLKNSDIPIVSYNQNKNIGIINAQGFYKWHLGLVPLNHHFYLKELYGNITKRLFELKSVNKSFNVILNADNFNIGQNINFEFIIFNKDSEFLKLEIFKEDNLILSEQIAVNSKNINYYNSFRDYGLYKVIVEYNNDIIEKNFVIKKDLHELSNINNNIAILNSLVNRTGGEIIELDEMDSYLNVDLNRIKKETIDIYKIRNNYFIISLLFLLFTLLWIVDRTLL
jgi:hypothetical protein